MIKGFYIKKYRNPGQVRIRPAPQIHSFLKQDVKQAVKDYGYIGPGGTKLAISGGWGTNAPPCQSHVCHLHYPESPFPHDPPHHWPSDIPCRDADVTTLQVCQVFWAAITRTFFAGCVGTPHITLLLGKPGSYNHTQMQSPNSNQAFLQEALQLSVCP